MIYYIVGKKTKEGTLGDDSENGSLTEYFELGWEYLSTHLHVKHLFTTGTLNDDDVIVTLRDRMFMYQGFWKNVISFEDYSSLINLKSVYFCDLIENNREGLLPNIFESKYKHLDSYKGIIKNIKYFDTQNFNKNNPYRCIHVRFNHLKSIDLCSLVEDKREGLLPNIINDKYEHWDSDKDVIKNIKYVDIKHFDISNPYCCIHVRFRNWQSYRNLSIPFWKDIIDKIVSSGLKVYVFGKDVEVLTDGESVFHVKFDEYASLLNNSNCKFFIGSMSGGTLVAQTFSHKNCKNFIIIPDIKTYNDSIEKDKHRVLYHIEEMNFSETPTSFVYLTNDIKEKDKKNTLISIENMINEIT